MFKITFVGLCLFLGVVNEPRTVIVLDVLTGDDVHGHHIQAHEGMLRVPYDSVVTDRTDWPFTTAEIDKKLYRLFPLRHQHLTLSGITNGPFDVTRQYQCEVPRVEEQCPAHDAVRPPDVLKAEALAWMELRSGKLDAIVAPNGAVSSVYSVDAPGEVTIIGASAAATWTLVVKQNTEMLIVNAPTGDEIRPNHFLAYYRVLMPSSCCTNAPFPIKRPECSPKPSLRIAGVRDPEWVSTVACSNSNYP